MSKRTVIILLLSVIGLTARAMTDSVLMAEVARTGELLKQQQFDSALVQVDRLLPIAKKTAICWPRQHYTALQASGCRMSIIRRCV